MRHEITTRIVGDTIAVDCRDCFKRLDNGYRQMWSVVELSEIAHEHIMAAERARFAGEAEYLLAFD